MSVSVPDVVANPDGSPAWVRDPRANALTPVSSDLWAALKKFLPDLDADDPYLYQCADPVISDRLIARAGSNPNQPPVSHRVHKQYLETWARFVAWAGRHAAGVDLKTVPQEDLEETIGAYLKWLGTETTKEEAKACRRRPITPLASASIKVAYTALRWCVRADRGLTLAKTAVMNRAIRSGVEAKRRTPVGFADLEKLIDATDKGPEANGCTLLQVPPNLRPVVAELWRLTERARMLVTWTGAFRSSEEMELKDGWITPISQTVRRVQFPRTKMRSKGTRVDLIATKDPKMCPLKALDAIAAFCAEHNIDRHREALPVVLLKGDGIISTAPGRAVTIRRRFHRICETAGVKAGRLEELVPHGMRHGNIAELRDTGVSDDDIQRHARHVNPETTARYGDGGGVGASPMKGML